MGEELLTQGGLDIQVIVTGIVGLITTITSGWVSWLFAKKKYNAEVDSNVIENMKQSLEFYTKLSDDNKARLDEALKRNETLEREISQLRQQMFELMNNICYDVTCELRARKPRKGTRATKQVKEECNYDTEEGK
jgi:hypothetical protein